LLFGSLIYAFSAILKYSESAMQINIMTSWHKYAVHAVLPDSTIYCREYPSEITYSLRFQSRGRTWEEVVNNEGEIFRSHFANILWKTYNKNYHLFTISCAFIVHLFYFFFRVVLRLFYKK
jgi:hypothetical protein